MPKMPKRKKGQGMPKKSKISKGGMPDTMKTTDTDTKKNTQPVDSGDSQHPQNDGLSLPECSTGINDELLDQKPKSKGQSSALQPSGSSITTSKELSDKPPASLAEDPAQEHHLTNFLKMFWRQTVEDPYVQPQREPPKPPYHDECDREFEFFGSWPLKEIEEMQSDLSIWINSYYKDNYWENAESDSDWDKEYEELEPHDHSDDIPPDYAALIDERMTAAQKQAIVEYLGDWCLYSDWDAMVATFPLKAHRHTAFILAVISKDIFQNLVADPFYYMDLGDEWEGNHEALPTPLGRELYKLWQNMKRVDGSRAAEWRASTVQMMNKYLKTNGSDSDLNGLRNYREGKIRPMEANDRTIGIRSYNTREAYINRLVKNMLAPDSLIFPMRPQDDPQKEQLEQYTRCRAQGLRKCYKRASDCAVRMWSLNHRIEFDANIHGIGPYKNGPRGLHELETPRKNWYPCRMNHCESIVDLPGRRTVMISWPAIWYILYDKRNKDGEIERVARRKAGYWEERDWWYVDEQGWSHEIAVPGSVLLAIPSEQKNSEFSSE